MADLLTTKQLQSILQVDRTTIYRMAENGKLPGIRVGGQWRFPRDQVELWLQRQSGAAAPSSTNRGGEPSSDASALFPMECIQLIQDTFADAFDVMMLVTDLAGQAITRPSNPARLFVEVDKSPEAKAQWLAFWTRQVNDLSLAPRFVQDYLGLLWARGLIRVGGQVTAMLIVGGIAPGDWPPSAADLEQMAGDLHVDPTSLARTIDQVHRLTAQQQLYILPFVQRIADVFTHVADERHQMMTRLQRIAEISRF